MSSGVIVALFSVLGMVAMAVWGLIDDRIEHTPGATIAGALLFGSLFCGLSGHWVPEGAGLLTLAVFVWILTLGDISLGRGHKA